MKGKLEFRDIEHKMKSHAIGRLNQELAKDLRFINELKRLRRTANLLLAKGHAKAELIVRKIDVSLENLYAKMDIPPLSDTRGHEVAPLRLNIDQLQVTCKVGDDKSVARDLINQVQAVVAGLPDPEVKVAIRYLQFCLELGSRTQDPNSGFTSSGCTDQFTCELCFGAAHCPDRQSRG